MSTNEQLLAVFEAGYAWAEAMKQAGQALGGTAPLDFPEFMRLVNVSSQAYNEFLDALQAAGLDIGSIPLHSVLLDPKPPGTRAQ